MEYAEMIVKLFLLLTGFGLGFLVACGGAARIVAEKHDLKIKLAKTEAELEAVKKSNTKVIEIKDERVADVDYGNF